MTREELAGLAKAWQSGDQEAWSQIEKRIRSLLSAVTGGDNHEVKAAAEEVRFLTSLGVPVPWMPPPPPPPPLDTLLDEWSGCRTLAAKTAFLKKNGRSMRPKIVEDLLQILGDARTESDPALDRFLDVLQSDVSLIWDARFDRLLRILLDKRKLRDRR
jgi:hypothetical protein